MKNPCETSFFIVKHRIVTLCRNRGRHGRRERWKRRIENIEHLMLQLDDGIYDLFTIEDLNYGFDRWLRRKMRNHRVRFRSSQDLGCVHLKAACKTKTRIIRWTKTRIFQNFI
jgi:hypothetical protein